MFIVTTSSIPSDSEQIEHRMAGIVHVVMRLLLMSFITPGVKGLSEQAFEISVPCEEDLVCLHVWQLSTSTTDNIAIVSNGKIQTHTSEDEDSKCILQIKDLTVEDVGRHRCQRGTDVLSPLNNSPVLTLVPGKTVSLQCIFLTYAEAGHCYTDVHQVSLMWVDEAGTEIQQDSEHQIKQESPCNVILTVTLQSPDSRKFRCQATVGEEVQTSVELRVRVPDLKGRGRGLIIDLETEPENQGWNQDAIGAAVGVVGCVVLTTLVTLFVVNRRRTRTSPDIHPITSKYSQLTDESSFTTSTNNVINTDNVIYADIILPTGPDRVWVQESESTEYACIRY